MLTRRQKEFIRHYIQTKNATKAAILAGYSERTASQAGSRLLTKVNVKAEIERYFKSLDMSKEDIIRAISELSKNAKTETNRLRALELLAKISKLMQDVAPQQVAIFQDFSKQLEELRSERVYNTTKVEDST